MLNALWIVLLGMAIIFAVLGILLLVMVLLSKLIRPRKKEEKRRIDSWS
ncbi:MAG: OadG family protein [Chloroflexi bacterium]|nr:OadG family protein [Chloroflexota bacterium]